MLNDILNLKYKYEHRINQMECIKCYNELCYKEKLLEPVPAQGKLP